MRVDTDCSSVCNLKSTQKMKANHEGALNKEGRLSFVCEMQITHPGTAKPSRNTSSLPTSNILLSARRLNGYVKALCCLELDTVGINRKLQNSARF